MPESFLTPSTPLTYIWCAPLLSNLFFLSFLLCANEIFFHPGAQYSIAILLHHAPTFNTHCIKEHASARAAILRQTCVILFYYDVLMYSVFYPLFK